MLEMREVEMKYLAIASCNFGDAANLKCPRENRCQRQQICVVRMYLQLCFDRQIPARNQLRNFVQMCSSSQFNSEIIRKEKVHTYLSCLYKHSMRYALKTIPRISTLIGTYTSTLDRVVIAERLPRFTSLKGLLSTNPRNIVFPFGNRRHIVLW